MCQYDSKPVQRISIYLKLLHSLLTGSPRARNLDKIGRVDVGKFVSIGRFSDVVVGPRARELHLGTSATLEFVEMLATTANECTMLNSRDFDTKDDAIAHVGGNLLKLGFDLGYELGFTSEVNLVSGLTRTGAKGN